MKNKHREQTLTEEIANGITHGIGAALSVAALSLLVVYASLQGDAWRIVSFSVYGATLVLLYLASTLYHSFTSPRLKSFFNFLDHTMIYLLIAGTYTPFTLVTLRGPWGWTLFGLIWGFALFGIVYKVFFINKYRFLSIGIYLAMGWLVLIAIGPLVSALPTGGLAWLIIGGLSYSVGVFFYAFDRYPFWHTIWHLFVLGGSVSHFLCVFWYVLPMEA